MHRIDTDGTVESRPTPPAAGSLVGYFSDGDALTGTSGTVISAAWLNAVQEEIASVILEAGLSLDKTATDQLKDAIIQIITDRAIAGTVGSSANRFVVTTAAGTVTASNDASLDETGNLGGVSTITVGAGSASRDESASVDIQSTDKGILIPRLSTSERDAITTPANSLVIFNTDANGFQFYNDGTWKSVTPRRQLRFEVNGPYYVGGSVQTGLLVERPGQTLRVVGATLYCGKNGTSGQLLVDVKASQNNGASWTSIFSAKPTILAAAGDYATASAVMLNASTTYTKTDRLRLDVESIPDGVPNDFVLVLESEAL